VLVTAGAAALAGPAVAAAASPGVLSGERLFLDVARYAAFGVKRTATPEDRAVATWLAQEATAAGAQAETRSFTLRQFTLRRSVLVVDGRAIDNQPFWFPKPTAGVLNANLTTDLAQARGKILLVVGESGLAGLRQIPPLTTAAAQAGASGLVIVQRTPSGQFYGHGRPRTRPCRPCSSATPTSSDCRLRRGRARQPRWRSRARSYRTRPG
jgi:hypothetical protein